MHWVGLYKNEKWTLSCLQTLRLSLYLDDSIVSTLSRAHNLESISVKGAGDYYDLAEQVPQHGL